MARAREPGYYSSIRCKPTYQSAKNQLTREGHPTDKWNKSTLHCFQSICLHFCAEKFCNTSATAGMLQGKIRSLNYFSELERNKKKSGKSYYFWQIILKGVRKLEVNFVVLNTFLAGSHVLRKMALRSRPTTIWFLVECAVQELMMQNSQIRIHFFKAVSLFGTVIKEMLQVGRKILSPLRS